MRHQWSSVPTLLIFLLQVCVAGGTALSAAPPSMEEMRKEWREAERTTMEVEGEYKFYHIKKYVKEALDKSPVEAGIPFVRNGYLWRSQSRFRTNYASPYSMSHDVLIVEPLSDDLSIVGSLAIEGDRFYEFWGRSDTMRGSLKEVDMGKVPGVHALSALQLNYDKILNYTWGLEGRAYSKYFQMSIVDIVTIAQDEEKVAITTRYPSTHSESEFHFLKKPGFPLTRMHSRVGGVQIEIQILSKVVDGISLPERYVEAVSRGPHSGETFVAELNLKPLQPGSPISKPINQDSFRDLGFEYKVVKEEETSTDYEEYRSPPFFILRQATKSDRILGAVSDYWWIILCLAGLAVVLCYAWIRYDNRGRTVTSQPVEEDQSL